MTFTIDRSLSHDDIAIVNGVGRLNMVTAPELRSAVTDAVTKGMSRIVVNLRSIEFMDSSGLGALISSLKTAREAGGDLRIACASEPVLMVLELSNVDRILRPYEDVDSAFA